MVLRFFYFSYIIIEIYYCFERIDYDKSKKGPLRCLAPNVGMSGKDMLLGSAREAVSYHAETFMFYTGAPAKHAPEGNQ